MRKYKNPLLLLLTAIIWGFAFTAQKSGMDHLGPLAFNGLRSIIGAIFLIPCCYLLDRVKSPEERETQSKLSRKLLYIGGLCCGIVLCVASTSQQIGIKYTTPGKAGFITALYIIIVPLLGLFMKKPCGLFVWFSVLLALFGFYLLCVTEESISVSKGDLFVLLCAFLFSLHILVVDYFAPKCDGVRLSCLQFFIVSVLCLIAMCIWEGLPSWEAIRSAGIPLLYAGIMSCGVAYTLQILGQRDVNPTVASLLMSLESTFAAIGGWLLLDDTLTMRQFLGCVIIFCAIVIAQIPPLKRKDSSNPPKDYDTDDCHGNHTDSRHGNLDSAEVDRILDKLSSSGRSSLTPEEEEILQEASRRLGDRR